MAEHHFTVKTSMIHPCATLIYLFCVVIPTTALFAQADFKHSVAKLHEDFNLLRSSLEEAHPGIYWYRSKSEIDDAFTKAYGKLDHEMTELEFYRIAAPIISKLGCGHTWIATTETTQEKIWETGKVLPLKLKFFANSAYCIQNNGLDSTSIVPGDEIISINNYSVDSILALSNKFSPGDGFIEVGKWKILDNVFNQFFTLYIDQPDQYTVEVRSHRGESKEVLVEPLPLHKIEEISKRRYRNVARQQLQNLELSFLHDNASAKLKIRAFDDWRNEGQTVRFSTALESIFTRLDSSKTKNLIIDLRDNDGGNEMYALKLYSYLTAKSFVGYKGIDFRTRHISFRKHTNTSALQYMLFKTFLRRKKINDTTYLLTNDNAIRTQMPAQKPFAGTIYVLINKGTFSSASDFAALLHNNNMATFIGEETGGSYYGNTSDYTFLLTLPNTKIKVNIPVARYRTNVSTGDNFGRGVMPHHTIKYTMQEFMQGVDKEMAAALALIEN